MAEVTVNKKIFTEIWDRIDQLRYRTVLSENTLRRNKEEVSLNLMFLPDNLNFKKGDDMLIPNKQFFVCN